MESRRRTLRSSAKLPDINMQSIPNQATPKPKNNPSSRKKPRFNNEAIISEKDRISNLPEPILSHILSFLDTRQVIQTSVLSNTWRTLWKNHTSFNFDFKELSSITGRNPMLVVNQLKFFDIVTKVLKKCQPLQLSYLGFSYDNLTGRRKSHDRMWKLFLGLLRDCRVRHLDLKLNFDYPSSIFAFEHLTVLKLNTQMEYLFPSYHIGNSMSLPSLETLHFQSVCFLHPTEVFHMFFSKCPLLSKLIITDCRITTKNFTISSTLLRHFEVDSIYGYSRYYKAKKPCMITIHTPNLVSFKCSSEIDVKYSFKNFSALKDAEINMESSRISHLTMQQKEELRTEMVNSLGGLCNAESIRVSGFILEVIGQDTEVFVSPFHALRHLKMKTWLSHDTIKAILCLLHHSDKVETLSMEIINSRVDLGDERSVFFSDCKFPHLRVLKIKGIQGFEEEVEFLKGMLKSAINLEELIIIKQKDPQGSTENRVEDLRETLLAFPSINIQLF